MKKIYFISAVLVVAAACFACKGEAIGVDETPPAVPSDSITIEEALERADAMFAILNSKATKSNSRVPRKIEVLGYNNPMTRSAGTTNSLFYVVNYEDNQGFAVLSAKHKEAPVYAICDEGQLDISDTTNPGVRMIAAALAVEAQSSGWYERIPDVIDYKYATNKMHVLAEELVAKYGPYGAQRKWGQSSPFNKYCPIINGQSALTSSAAVATALIMAHHKYPTSIMGHKLNWKEMDNVNTASGPNQLGLEGVARLLSSLGQPSFLNVQYGAQNSSASSYLVPGVLAFFQYEVGGFEPYYLRPYEQEQQSRQQIIDHFQTNKSPLYMRGSTDMTDDQYVSGSNFNHDWIVDGLMQINTRIRQNVVTHVMRYDYIYCNWGWKGQANGWYTYRMLDTFRGPLKGEIGEVSSTHKYNFYDKIEILRNIKRYY